MSKKNQILSMTQKVLRHMQHKAGGHHMGGILLSGDPGIGKTSFIRLLSQVLGIQAVIIEVPHITEEHLINIPFIVFPPQGGTKSGVQKVGQDYKLVLAQSNLYSQLVQIRQMPDAQYLQMMQKAPKPVQQLYQALGGTADTIPPIIQQVRHQTKSILFLDEFYRQTSTRIRNILRGILNNRIGMHDIPNSVYVVYASNLRDAGLEDIPANQQFTGIKFRTPAVGDWFNWLVAKYQQDSHVKVNERVMAAFKKQLKDEDLSHVDVAREVRISPRRWEQLIMYVNSAIPVGNHAEARALLTNVKNNFINYQTGEHAELAEKILTAVAELIQETSGFHVSSGDVQGKHEWRDALDNLITAQVKMGKHRQHVPVVSGPPGIGKTYEMSKIAAKHNLIPIMIDVSEYFAEDVIGLPLPGNVEGGNEDVTVRFSLPKLFQHINNLIEQRTKEHKEKLRKTGGDRAVAEWDKQKYKYLIFFDEINRVDEKTFNAFRKVILEKSFGPSGDEEGKELTLPDEAVVVAAMNPEDKGTAELTHHFRDVVDIVPAGASWKDFRRWIDKKEFATDNDNVKEAALNIVDQFAKKFGAKGKKSSPDTAPFHMDLGGELYVSPREYSDLIATLVREMDAAAKEQLSKPEVTIEEVRDAIYDAVGEAFEDSLSFILHKHGLEDEEVMEQIKAWVEKLPDETFAGLLSKKVKKESSLSDRLSAYFEGHDITSMPQDIAIVNANNDLNNAQFIEEVRNVVINKLKDDKATQKFIVDETQPKIVLGKDELTTDPKQKVSLLTNLVLGLLYTLHLHQFQNDRINTVGKALSVAISDTLSKLVKSGKISADLKSELSMAVVALRSEIEDLKASL